MSLYDELKRVFQIERGANVAHLSCTQPKQFADFVGGGNGFGCAESPISDIPNGLVFLKIGYGAVKFTRQNFQLVMSKQGMMVDTATKMLANNGYLIAITNGISEDAWLLYRRNYAEFKMYRYNSYVIVVARRKTHLDADYIGKVESYKHEFANHDRDYPDLSQTLDKYTIHRGKIVPEFYVDGDMPNCDKQVMAHFAFGNEAQDNTLPRPLMPSTIGHTTQFITMGVLDGKKIERDGKTFLIRGESIQERDGFGGTTMTPQFTILDDAGNVTRLTQPTQLIDFILENPFGLMQSIQEAMQPQYDMNIEPEWGQIYDTIKINSEELLKTQELVISALIELLLRQRHGFLLGEPSVGKSIMGITIMYVLHLFELYKNQEPELVASLCHRYGVKPSELRGIKSGSLNMVYCPAILPRQWVNELQKALGNNVVAEVANKPSDLIRLSRMAKESPMVMHVAVMTYEKLKLSDGTEYAVIAKHDTEKYRKKVRAQRNEDDDGIALYGADPTTGNLIRDYLGNRIKISRFTGTPTRRFYKGQYSTGEYIGLREVRDGNGDVVYQDGSPKKDVATRTIKQNHGYSLFQQKRRVSSVVRNGKEAVFGGVFRKLGVTPTKPYKMALADVIKKLDNVGIVVVDEAHRIKSSKSLAGISVRKTFSKAQKVLLVTATFTGGTADSLFHLIFPFNSELRKKYRYEGELDFARDYGNVDKDGKVLAGIIPEALRFIIDSAVFVSIVDLGNVMPKFKEKIIAVDMTEEQKDVYDSISGEMRGYGQTLLGDKTIWGAMWHAQRSIPDQVWHNTLTYHHRRRNHMGELEIRATFERDGLGEEPQPKEIEASKLVKLTLDKGERPIVFTTQSDTRNIMPRIEHILREQAGANPFIMLAQIEPEKRHEYMKKHVDSGFDTLICNPQIVQEGINLTDFTDIVFLDAHGMVTAMIQASRRTWRITQKAPEVTVYYMCYRNTPQIDQLYRVAKRSAFLRQFQGSMATEFDLEISEGEGYGALANQYAKAISPADVQDAFDKGESMFGYAQSIFNTPINRKQYREHRPDNFEVIVDDEQEV